jgi:hypothetical protein
VLVDLDTVTVVGVVVGNILRPNTLSQLSYILNIESISIIHECVRVMSLVCQ